MEVADPEVVDSHVGLHPWAISSPDPVCDLIEAIREAKAIVRPARGLSDGRRVNLWVRSRPTGVGTSKGAAGRGGRVGISEQLSGSPVLREFALIRVRRSEWKIRRAIC